MAAPLTAWSYSRAADYAQCPLRFKLKHIDKIQEPPSAAMARGRDIHKEAELFVLGKGPLTDSLKKFEDLVTELAAFPGVAAELKAGFTRHWKKTGYFAKDVWLRAVFDIFLPYADDTALVADFKTGKRYASNDEQVELFALAAMCFAPNVKTVETRLWYLDTGEEEIAEFDATQRDALISKWEAKVAPMFNDSVFAPRPNDKCRFCHFSKSRLNLCKFG